MAAPARKRSAAELDAEAIYFKANKANGYAWLEPEV
jgi:hypothetical protein